MHANKNVMLCLHLPFIFYNNKNYFFHIYYCTTVNYFIVMGYFCLFYRKLAQKWHPDNFQDEDEKKKAEKKFMDIAAAKEVLTDPGMYNF